MKKLNKIKTTSLNEIFQAIDIKFAFLHKENKDEYTQISVPCKCRDFLGDCIWSHKTGKQASIYGFSFNASKTPLDTEALRLSLTFPNQETIDNFYNNYPKIVNKKEHKAKTKLSTIYKTDVPLTIIIEADKIWQSVIWKLTLLTFYMKCASYKDLNCLQSPEDSYISYLTDLVEKVLLSKVQCNDEYIHDSIYYAHNYSGFISVIKGSNKEQHEIIFGDV